jgi:Uma2 family endonuclease
MSTARRSNRISVEDYLAGERSPPVKSEYVGGIVYATVGGRNAHNIIKGNIFVAFHNRLKGRPCRPFDSDTKIRIRLPTHTRFYYPDVSVVRRPNPQSDSFQDEPAVIVEVLSRKTRRIDEGEKRDAYLTIPSLVAYLLVEQESPAVVVYRRTEEGFACEPHVGLDSVIPLPEIGTQLPLSEAFDGVEFVPEDDDNEAA